MYTYKRIRFHATFCVSKNSDDLFEGSSHFHCACKKKSAAVDNGNGNCELEYCVGSESAVAYCSKFRCQFRNPQHRGTGDYYFVGISNSPSDDAEGVFGVRNQVWAIRLCFRLLFELSLTKFRFNLLWKKKKKNESKEISLFHMSKFILAVFDREVKILRQIRESRFQLLL